MTAETYNLWLLVDITQNPVFEVYGFLKSNHHNWTAFRFKFSVIFFSHASLWLFMHPNAHSFSINYSLTLHTHPVIPYTTKGYTTVIINTPKLYWWTFFWPNNRLRECFFFVYIIKELTWDPSLSFRMHSIVLMVITTGSEPSLVQGTWIRSSWIWPLMNVKGSFSSYKRTKM